MWLTCFSGLKYIPKWNWLAVCAMGNSSGHNNTLGIPSGKGPHKVGCTDLMVGHTIQVSGTLNGTYIVCHQQTFQNLLFMYFPKGIVLQTLLSVPSVR